MSRGLRGHPQAAAVRRFSLPDLPREPWKNGGGWTRTIASHEVDGQTLWRVSVADIDAAGPFSRFEGMDRTAVMIRGARLRLAGLADDRNAAHDLVFDGPGSRLQFPGERALHGDAPAIPTQLWNVMVRRGHGRADVAVARDEAVSLPLAPHVLVLVLRGEFALAGPDAEAASLHTDEGLHLRGLQTPWILAPRQAGSLLLITALD